MMIVHQVGLGEDQRWHQPGRDDEWWRAESWRHCCQPLLEGDELRRETTRHRSDPLAGQDDEERRREMCRHQQGRTYVEPSEGTCPHSTF
jgi:hypothetical protein